MIKVKRAKYGQMYSDVARRRCASLRREAATVLKFWMFHWNRHWIVTIRQKCTSSNEINGQHQENTKHFDYLARPGAVCAVLCDPRKRPQRQASKEHSLRMFWAPGLSQSSHHQWLAIYSVKRLFAIALITTTIQKQYPGWLLITLVE